MRGSGASYPLLPRLLGKNLAFVAPLISLFAGGLVTGRLAGVLTVGDGVLHGGVMWGLSVVFTLWLTAAGVEVDERDVRHTAEQVTAGVAEAA